MSMENFFLVADVEICEHSRKQIEVVQEKGINIKGAILCNTDQFKDNKVCKQVPAFPTFCNSNGKCVAGLRETAADFDDLLHETL